MNGAGLQAHSKAVDSIPFAAEYYFANRSVVRQHADDDLAVEEVGDVRCGLEAKRRELAHLLRTPDIGDNPMSGGGKVCRHCHAHLTKSDKADARARHDLHGTVIDQKPSGNPD